MLVSFSARRILALMLVDGPGSIGLLYAAAVICERLAGSGENWMARLAMWDRPEPLSTRSVSSLLPTMTVVAVGLVWPFYFFALGVYDGFRNSTVVKELRNVAVAILASYATLAAILFFASRTSSRLVLLVFLFLDMLVLLSARLAIRGYRRLQKRSNGHRHVVIVVGAGRVGRNVAKQFSEYPCADMEVVGFVDDDPAKLGQVIEGIPVIGTTADLPAIVEGQFVEDAVIALPLRAHEHLLATARRLSRASVRVHVVPDLFTLSVTSAHLYGFGGIPVIDLGWTGISGWRLFSKRVFDLFIGSALLIVTAPVMLVISIAIKLDSHGPVFFRQRRVGRHHRPFEMLKFRTMVAEADPEPHRRHITELITRNLGLDDAKHNGRESLKLESDPRVTRLGAFLRKLSLDELPQLLNVIRGDMSLVGPRPPLAYEVELYNEWHRRRFEAPPGMTGLWQVKGRNAVSFDEMVRMDLDYITNQSLWLDLQILGKTPMAVYRGRGAG